MRYIISALIAAERRIKGSKPMTASLQVVSDRSAMDTDKQKALDAALAQIDRAFGKGSAMRLGSREAIEIETISTGSLGLDIALGIGGLPRGRVVEVYGPESSGKTTLALHAVAAAQAAGGVAAFIDAEHALDPIYARKLGVDVDNLIVSQPDTGEQALEITDTLVRSNAVDILVIDSVAALVPRAEIEGEFDIMYGDGTSTLGEILDLGVKAGLVEKSGAWFSYDSIRIGQGRENAKTYLKENPEVADRLERSIRGKTDEVAEAMMTGPDAEDDL